MKISKTPKHSPEEMISAIESRIDELSASTTIESATSCTDISNSEIVDWLADHDQAYEDACSHFEVDDLVGISTRDLYDWISDHEWLSEDFERHFDTSLDDCFAATINCSTNAVYTVEYYLNRACRERRPGTPEDNEDYIVEQFAADSDLDAMQHSIALAEDEDDITISEDYPTEEDCVQHLNGVDWSDGSPFVVKLYTDNKVIWDSGSDKEDFLVYDEFEDMDDDEDEVTSATDIYESIDGRPALIDRARLAKRTFDHQFWAQLSDGELIALRAVADKYGIDDEVFDEMYARGLLDSIDIDSCDYSASITNGIVSL